MDWYVYILLDERSRTHVGITQDIEFATFTHWRGRKAPQNCSLVYYERWSTEREAKVRRKELKKLSPWGRRRFLDLANPWRKDLSINWMSIFSTDDGDQEGGVGAHLYDPKIGPVKPRSDSEALPLPVEWEPTVALHA